MRHRIFVGLMAMGGFALLLAACSAGGGGVEKTVYVGPALVDCVGVGPQQCMLIKENPEDNWQYYYNTIEGFEYEEGFQYELLIEETTVEDAPADASTLKWTLVEEVSKEPVVVKTVYIGPEQVECVGVGPQLCFQYKENPEDDWQLYYDTIEGFEWEAGYTYELRVAETQVENPPADSSSIKLSLIQVVDKSEAQASLLGTIWQAVTINGKPVIEGTIIQMGIAEFRLGGTAGCNTYNGPFEVSGNQVTIGPLGSTRIACPDPIKLQEGAYLQALQSTASYQLVDGELQLSNEAGEMVLTFTLVEAAPLEGTQWELVSLNNGQQATVNVLDGTHITALFEDGTVSGSAGCNSYTAPYEVDGDNLSLGLSAVTEEACFAPEGIMLQETQYIAALQSAATYSILADRLELIDGSGATAAIFKAVEPRTLEGTLWEVLFYNNGKEAVVGVLGGTRITALFEAGTMAGSAGCNQYNAGYQLDGDNIAISPGASTMMFCGEPEGVMDQESLYLAALETVATWSIRGDILEFRTESGALAVQYKVAEPVALEGKPWTVTLYNNGRGGAVSVIIGTELTMLFEGGTVSGSAGCNSYNAAYEMDGENISVGPAATTRMMCGEPEGIMDQENEFLAALQQVATYSVDGQKLDMRWADGAIGVQAQAGEAMTQ